MFKCHGVQLSSSMIYAQMSLDLDLSPSHTHRHTHSQYHLWLFGFQDISLAVKESTAAQLEAIIVKYEQAAKLKRKLYLTLKHSTL